MLSLLILGLALQWFFYPFTLFADAILRYQFMEKLIFAHHVTMMKYSLIGPLFSAPLFVLDKLIGSQYFVVRYNFILFILTTIILYKLIRPHVTRKMVLTFLIILTFASMLPGHLIHYYTEVFSVLTATVGILLLEKKKYAVAAILLTISTANIPTTIVPLGLLCVWLAWRNKRIWFLIIPVGTIILILLDAKLRMPRTLAAFTTYLSQDKGFPTVLPFSGQPGFSYPILLGILNELFSFGKGLLFFAPGLLLIPLAFKTVKNAFLKNVLTDWCIFLFGLVLVYAKWWGWYGGWFWGPRFLLFAAVPSSLALAIMLTQKNGTRLKSVFILIISLWSFWVGVNGVIFGQKGLEVCTVNNYSLEHLCWFTPEFSVLFHPFISVQPVMAAEWIIITYSVLLWLLISMPGILNSFSGRHKSHRHEP
jgi:hypothetical protein